MATKSFMCVFILFACLICQSGNCSNPREAARIVLKRQAELNAESSSRQQLFLHSQQNQRPTQFVASNFPQASSSLSQQQAVSPRAALILPANNQIQPNNFPIFSHPSSKPLTANRDPGAGAELFSQLNNDVQYNNENVGKNGSKLAGAQSSTLNLSAPTFATNDQAGDGIANKNLRLFYPDNFELALKQANDEVVGSFQTSLPAINIAEQTNFDWLRESSVPLQNSAQPTSQQQQRQQAADNQGLNYKSQREQQQQQQGEQPHEQTSNEQSNNIVQIDHATPTTLSASASSSVDDSQQLQLQQQRQHEQLQLAAELQKESAPTGSGAAAAAPTAAATPLANQNGSQSQPELSNNVFYEGPATAPPAGDYYFSSAERPPNNNDPRASNAWWALGFGHELERASNLTEADYLDYCAKSELLVTNKQRSLCKTHPKIMPIVARGLKMAVDECQSRFTSSRWNCSLVLQDSMQFDSAFPAPKAQVFGDVMQHPNRERSFLNAIIAAGLAHAMTKACSQGELPEECSCDKRIRSKNNKGKIEWIACSDDIDFGARFSRDFTDNSENYDSDTTSMINTHNYEVGRRVFKSATDITCTCQNGENGLCQTKRCWKHLGPFTDIGDELVKRYESATHVQLSSKDPHKLRPVRRGVRKPRRKDLVYIDESPDYCSADTRLGVLGTQNRRCNSTSLGPNSCSLLCCGRGYQMVIEEIEDDCNCKFVWCCQVKCDKCKRQVTNEVCN